MWEEENNQLQCSFEFNNFVDAFAFMTKVAFAAEKMGHHPNWTNMYKKVHSSYVLMMQMIPLLKKTFSLQKKLMQYPIKNNF
jgi:4a-hydroxytetrahydrobiopterin dehydratase